MPWLSSLILLPLLGALVLPFLPASLIRWWANGILLAGLALAAPLWHTFDRAAPGYQFVERPP